MAYCCIFLSCQLRLEEQGRAPVKLGALCPRSGRKRGPLNWAVSSRQGNDGAKLPTQSQGESIVRRGATRMSTHIRTLCLSGWFVCVLLVCIAATNASSDTDKTIVDLERGRPEAASRYHRPRAAHLYQYDKTEIDLAAPLAQQPAEAQPASQRPGTLAPAAPAPTTPPPQTPPQ
jgi:hypothetical protein